MKKWNEIRPGDIVMWQYWETTWLIIEVIIDEFSVRVLAMLMFMQSGNHTNMQKWRFHDDEHINRKDVKVIRCKNEKNRSTPG